MSRSKSFIVVAAMILAAAWAPSCGAAEIVIGYSGPLSGPAAEYGEDCFSGVDMAIREINARGGISIKGRVYSFRLEKMDDKVDPQTAISNAQRLRKDQKAIAIFNPVATTIVALMKINEENRNEFILMSYTSMPQITEMGNRLLVNITTPFTVYAQTQADIAWEKGWRRGAMVVTAGAYGDAWRKVFGDIWMKKGGTITADKSANYYTRTDFAAPLTEALATDPDFLLIGGPSSTTVMIIEQARAKGFEGGFVMIDQAKLDAIYPVMRKPLLLEGAIGLARVKDIHYPASQSFSDQYAANYKRPLTWETVANYTSMHALAKAIAAAGTPDNVRAIRAAFSGVFPLLGDQYPMEMFGISNHGRLIFQNVVQTMKHGKFTEPKVFVWWLKTKREFDQIKKISKGGNTLTWRPLEN